VKDNFKDFLDYYRKFDFQTEQFEEHEFTLLLNTIKQAEIKLLSAEAPYIPAERLFVPILKGASMGLLNNNVAIPKHILRFASDYETASNTITEFDLSFIKQGISYKKVNGVDRLFYTPKKSVLLSESATGFQSIIPLLLTILYHKDTTNRSYVIEEPEINLFPKAQYSLVKFLEKERSDGGIDTTYIHTYTTHSPYILSAFNNMLYAFKKWENTDKSDFTREKLEQVLPDENWLNPDNFNAYSIQDGVAIQILDRESGLIGENIIDEISDEMSDDFDRLMSI